MTTKAILLEQFNACYDDNGWFVALKNALKNLSADEAIQKPNNLDNSIWEILAHLDFYNERWLKQFKGETVSEMKMENSETFVGAKDVSETAWAAEIERFERIMNDWRDALRAADEAKFSETVSAENPATWAEIVSLVNAHNAHHGGQIVVIRKLQGSWKSAGEGVS